MQIINKGQNNTLVFTLTEKATLTNPTYLFRLINDVTKSAKSFIAVDNSSYKYRYNQFTVTETSGAEVLTSGVVTLNPTGFWHYEIYEQSSTSNLDYTLSTSKLEVGKIKVIGTATTINTYDSQSKTYIAYGTGSS